MERIGQMGGCDFTIPGAEPHYPPDLGIEPRHLDIALAVDVPARTAAGTVVTTVRANRAGVRRLVLFAVDFEDLTVADAAGGEVSFDYDGKELSVLWAEPFENGEERKLAVSYRVVEPVSGLIFAVPDDEYPDRAPWAATDHETERARYWLPCVDLPAVRTTLSFHLTAAKDFTILANGVLTGEEDNGDGTKTAHWELDWPCPSYLLCFAIGDFVRADDEPVGEREIAYFAARGRATPEDLSRSFGRTPAIMRWLEKRLATPFPFPKYFQFALPSFGGAMENISLVSWDDKFAADEALHREVGWLIDSVNVHEMGHSYFGDAVVIRDFAHAWLKESWATYLQACWLEDNEGEDEFRFELLGFSTAYRDEADGRYRRPIVTRVFNSSWNMYDRHLYPGGAFRLHMLRQLLGDDVFWPAVADYLQTFAKRTVETEDFRKKLEAHSGRSLVRFFDEWIYGKGYPKLEVKFSHDSDEKRGTLTVDQTQVPAAAKKREEEEAIVFHFDLAVDWEDADGKWHRRTIEIGKKKESFHLDMPAKPKQIRIDPEQDVLVGLDFNPGDDMLRHALKSAPDVVSRIRAAHELAKTGKRKNLGEVAAACTTEPFWGVRQEMVKAIAESKAASAPGHLVDVLDAETDPRVRRTVAARLKDFREPVVTGALDRFLDRKDIGPLARTAALRSLGARRGEAPVERLSAAVDEESPRDFVRTGALVGLAETRTAAAAETLLAKNGYGALSDDAAPAAAGALGLVANHLERPLRSRIVERLRDLLRDPRDRVRDAAADALKTAEASEAADDVEKMMASLPVQDHPDVKRIVSALRKGPSDRPSVSALTERLEKIEEHNRKLEERLEKLEKDEAVDPAG